MTMQNFIVKPVGVSVQVKENIVSFKLKGLAHGYYCITDAVRGKKYDYRVVFIDINRQHIWDMPCPQTDLCGPIMAKAIQSSSPRDIHVMLYRKHETQDDAPRAFHLFRFDLKSNSWSLCLRHDSKLVRKIYG